jgi:hypothetical protein
VRRSTHVSEDAIVAALSAVSFHVTDEPQLHAAISHVLREAGLAFEHEVKLGPRERIDFLVGDVGMEVKIGGSASSVVRQLVRYHTRRACVACSS